MDPDQFLAGITPSAKRSKLTPYRSDIAKLRNSGCSLQQICDYLSHQNVSIKPSGLAKFLSKKQPLASAAIPIASQPVSPKNPITAPSVSTTSDQSDASAENTSDDIKSIEQLKAEFPTMPRMRLVRKYSAQFDRPIKNRFLEKSASPEPKK
jgi:hypothetical protein